MELHLPAFLLTIYQIMVNVNNILREVAIFPSQSEDFSYACACPKHDRKQRHPVFVRFRTGNKIEEPILLCLCQRMTLWFLPVMALLDFCNHTVGRICSYEPIPHCYIKDRMKNRMNYLHTVRLKSNIFNEVDVEPLDITILDVGNVLRAYFVLYILPVHILIVGSCRCFKLVLSFNVGVIKAVQRHPVRRMGADAVINIPLDSFYLSP